MNRDAWDLVQFTIVAVSFGVIAACAWVHGGGPVEVGIAIGAAASMVFAVAFG